MVWYGPYFGPDFFQGHKTTHVFKTRIVGADWLGVCIELFVFWHKAYSKYLDGLNTPKKLDIWLVKVDVGPSRISYSCTILTFSKIASLKVAVPFVHDHNLALDLQKLAMHDLSEITTKNRTI